jgi:hypothetical protein
LTPDEERETIEVIRKIALLNALRYGGKEAQHIIEHLNPLLTKEFKRKWKEVLKTCR